MLVLGQMMASIWPWGLAMAVFPYEIRFVTPDNILNTTEDY
jgi:hypothetical protein